VAEWRLILSPISREDAVTPLRHRMIQDLQLRGYADRTVEAYIRAVAQLARFHHASPDTLMEERSDNTSFTWAPSNTAAAALPNAVRQDATPFHQHKARYPGQLSKS
jgi:hypothetical protein